MANIFKRIGDVISANLNDLIDRVEDPEQMVKQIIREMEDNIRNAKDGVISAIASEKQLEKELESQRHQSAHWLKRAEQALQEDKESLAREALARKKEHDNIITSLAPSWEAAKKTSEKLKSQLRAMESKLEEAKRKKGSLIARKRAAQAQQQMKETQVRFEAGLDSETKFSRMEDKVTELEAQVEAAEELESEHSQLERQFLQMEVDTEVEHELAALKKKIEEET